jgi:hypothetical protein
MQPITPKPSNIWLFNTKESPGQICKMNINQTTWNMNHAMEFLMNNSNDWLWGLQNLGVDLRNQQGIFIL